MFFYNPKTAIKYLKGRSISEACIFLILVLSYYFCAGLAVKILNAGGGAGHSVSMFAGSFFSLIFSLIIYFLLFLFFLLIFVKLFHGKNLDIKKIKQFIGLLLFFCVLGFPVMKLHLNHGIENGVRYTELSFHAFLLGVFTPAIKFLQSKVILLMGALKIPGCLGFHILHLANILMFTYVLTLAVISLKEVFGASYKKGLLILVAAVCLCLVFSYFDALYINLAVPYSRLFLTKF